MFDSCRGQGFISLAPHATRPTSCMGIPDGEGEIFLRQENEWSFASISLIRRHDVVLKDILPSIFLIIFPER